MQTSDTGRVQRSARFVQHGLLVIGSALYALRRNSLIGQPIPDHSSVASTLTIIPIFYRQIGEDPEQLLAQGLETLAERFKLQK